MYIYTTVQFGVSTFIEPIFIVIFFLEKSYQVP